jgi:hypothetical protein
MDLDKANLSHQVLVMDCKHTPTIFVAGTVIAPLSGCLNFAGFRSAAMISDRAEIHNIAFSSVHDLGTHGSM